MKNLKEIIFEAENKKTAIGHFNISDLTGLKAVFEAAREMSKQQNIEIPIIIGVSEGERGFIGVRQAVALIKSLREEYSAQGGSASGGNYPIFLNADHTKSLEKIKEAVEAGFDAVMFDASQLPLEENIKQIKEVVKYVKNANSEVLVEGELGCIRGNSTILTKNSEDVEIKEGDLTKPEEAGVFIKETGIDLLAPAVGNIHGIISSGNPHLNIERIKEVRLATTIPLVLHGGSGIRDEEILSAIEAGVSIIHINTELRLAWRRGLEMAIKEKPEEIAPYKMLPIVVEEIKKIIEHKLKLFNKML